MRAQVAGKLHGEGGGARNRSQGPDVLHEGAQHRDGVDTGVIEDAAILVGQEQAREQRRHALEGHPVAECPSRVSHLAEQSPAAILDA